MDVETAPLAIQCNLDELQLILRADSMKNADYYIVTLKGNLIGIRSHEDPSASGLWVEKAEQGS